MLGYTDPGRTTPNRLERITSQRRNDGATIEWPMPSTALSTDDLLRLVDLCEEAILASHRRAEAAKAKGRFD
jgi:hypothetical protein